MPLSSHPIPPQSHPSYIQGLTHPSTSTRTTYRTLRSLAFPPQDWASATDADAPADEWDDAEYTRQMFVHLQKQYERRLLMELRRECKRRKLRVRGNKNELVDRLAADDVRIMNGSGV